MLRRVGSLMLVAVLIAAFVQPVAAAPPPQEESPVSPFQQALQEALQDRAQAGLPVPAVSYKYQVQADPKATLNRTQSAPEHLRILATTTLQFANPQQAGYERWPASLVSGDLPAGANGTAMAGDYSALIRSQLEARFPGIWQRYTFGQEPRRYTFEETIDISYPETGGTSDVRMLAAAPAAGRTGQNIIFGWSYPGPNIDYTIGGKWEVCVIGCMTVAEARAGFALDWNVGLRLPTRVTVEAPVLMTPGNSYDLSAALEPLDWAADDYARAGMLPENGNEFVLRFNFFLGAKLKLLGISVVDWYLDAAFNRSKSFTTPFGMEHTFPLPVLDLPPSATGLEYSLGDALGLGVGLNIEPFLTSDRIEAAWRVHSGAASGNGTLRFSAPGEAVTFGPVTTDSSGASSIAVVRLSDLRYWFSVFLLRLRGYLTLNVFGYGTRSGNFPIADIDLSQLTNGLSLGPHRLTPISVEHTTWVAFPPTISTFTVNRTDDDFNAGMCQTPTSPCTLRAAIWWANFAPGPNTVLVPAGVYRLTRAGALEDNADTGDLDIFDELTITGDGMDVTTIDGNRLDRVFEIQPGATLNLQRLTVTNGETPQGIVPQGGGGLYNRGTVRVEACAFVENTADYGGGVHNSGTLELNAELSGNTARKDGGGLYNDGTALIAGTIRDNSAGGGGGGILNAGVITIGGAQIVRNTAANGGGIENGNGGQLTLADSDVLSNTATLRGGGLINFQDSTVQMDGATFADNRVELVATSTLTDLGGGGLENMQNAVMTINASVFSNNRTRTTGIPLGGGAIRNLGDLTLTNSSLIGNASDYGGAIHNGQYAGQFATLRIADNCLLADNSAIGGGGLYNDGTAEIADSTIGSIGAGNSSTGTLIPGNEAIGGGGIGNWGGVLYLNAGTVIVDNRAQNGGGLQNGNNGQVTIQGSRIYSNTAEFHGGGLANFETGNVLIQNGSRFEYNSVRTNDPLNPNVGGGAIYNFAGGLLAINGATFTGNSAVSENAFAELRGGAIHNRGSLVLFNAAFTANRAHLGGGIFTDSTPGATLQNVTLDENQSIGGAGGGLYIAGGSVRLEQSAVTRNTAIAGSALYSSCGGGILVSTGELTLLESVIDANESNVFPGAWGYGGGLCNQGGIVQSFASTFSRNIAGGRYGGIGAGIFNNTGTIDLINSTISGNQAFYGGSLGGGIANERGRITLTFSTLADNSAAQADSIRNAGDVLLRSTIIAGSGGATNCLGSLGDNGYNLQWPDSSCGAMPSADPHLGTLADNNGPTHTHALLPDSAAIDAIPPGDCWRDALGDQRGVKRPQGPACDIGAYELIEQTVTAAPGTPAYLILEPQAGNPGFAGTLIPMSGPLQMIAAAYAGNPMPVSLLDAGSGVIDLRVPNAQAGDRLDAVFYYPPAIGGATEQYLQLWYLAETGWQPVTSTAGLPIKNTADNPDGMQAGGRFLITFDAHSNPPITGLHGTVFAMAVRGANICAQTIDSFNRADGPIGTGWAGTRKDYRVAYEQGDVLGGGPLYWNVGKFGANQGACVTLTRIDPADACHSLLLKVQDTSWGKGAIDVFYLANTGQIGIDVFTPAGAWEWERVMLTDATVPEGGRFAALAFDNGIVQVYVNDRLIGEGQAGSYFAKRGGKIGLWFEYANEARFDDFAGGMAR